LRAAALIRGLLENPSSRSADPIDLAEPQGFRRFHSASMMLESSGGVNSDETSLI
jgi:hypothetical protein